MKWLSHMVIGAGLTFTYAPAMVPVGILGATAPDWLELVLKKLGRPVKHRAETHYLGVWLGATVGSLVLGDPWQVMLAFSAGGLSHVVADSLTPSGIRLGPWSEQRFTLFGGRIRTGRPEEYFVAMGVLILCLALAWGIRTSGDVGFWPFFWDWGGMYSEGLVDAYEWKQNRFRWF